VSLSGLGADSTAFNGYKGIWDFGLQTEYGRSTDFG